MIGLLAGGLPQPFTPLVWVWGARLEMEDEEVWIGDGAAPELTLAVTLAAPAYFARIACRFALLAAMMSSTGGGEGCKSRSMSASTAECGRFVLLSAGGSFSDKNFEDAGTGVGELVLRVRGDILKRFYIKTVKRKADCDYSLAFFPFVLGTCLVIVSRETTNSHMIAVDARLNYISLLSH